MLQKNKDDIFLAIRDSKEDGVSIIQLVQLTRLCKPTLYKATKQLLAENKIIAKEIGGQWIFYVYGSQTFQNQTKPEIASG